MFLLRLLSKLSLSTLYGLAALLFFLSFHVFRYRRKTVQKNLQNSFPDKSTRELREIEKLFYRRFSYYTVETLKLLTISREEMISRVSLKNSSGFEEDLRSGQSVIVLASHQFNWEWVLIAAKAHLGFPMLAVYQRINNKSFDKLMIEIRSRFGVQPVEKDNLLTIARDKGEARAIGFVADQSPHRKIKNPYWTNFLSQETAFFPSIDFLPKLTSYPVYYIRSRFVSKGHYEIEWVKLSDPPYEKESTFIIDRYIEEVEKLIREEPSAWLWTHNRWKLKRKN